MKTLPLSVRVSPIDLAQIVAFFEERQLSLGASGAMAHAVSYFAQISREKCSKQFDAEEAAIDYLISRGVMPDRWKKTVFSRMKEELKEDTGRFLEIFNAVKEAKEGEIPRE